MRTAVQKITRRGESSPRMNQRVARIALVVINNAQGYGAGVGRGVGLGMTGTVAVDRTLRNTPPPDRQE